MKRGPKRQRQAADVNGAQAQSADWSARLDALTARVKGLDAVSSVELTRSLDFLREQWDCLREDVAAFKMLDDGSSDAVIVGVGESLEKLERACEHAGVRCELRRGE